MRKPMQHLMHVLVVTLATLACLGVGLSTFQLTTHAEAGCEQETCSQQNPSCGCVNCFCGADYHCYLFKDCVGLACPSGGDEWCGCPGSGKGDCFCDSTYHCKGNKDPE
jgi:hypothetical protein